MPTVEYETKAKAGLPKGKFHYRQVVDDSPWTEISLAGAILTNKGGLKTALASQLGLDEDSVYFKGNHISKDAYTNGTSVFFDVDVTE